MGQVQVERVVFDTNVVVSGLLFGGIPGKLVSLWKGKRIKAFTTAAIIDEWVRVLTYPKFSLSENEIEYLIYQEILPYFEVASVASVDPPVIKKDPSDDKFIACAVAGNSRTIISGDRHLLEIKTYKDIDIVSPSQFLATRRYR